MPRLVHQFLQQNIHAQQHTPQQAKLAELIQAQHRHAKWQKWTTLSIAVLVLLQLASLIIILIR